MEKHLVENLSGGGVREQIKGNSIILKDTFYIDNLTSTRLQDGTANNILTVRQLNESLVRGLARAWQCKKMIGSGMTFRKW